MIKYYLLVYENSDFKIVKKEDLSKFKIPAMILPIKDEFIKKIEKLEEK